MAPTATEQWKIGDVTITKVVEFAAWQPLEFLGQMLPSFSPEEAESIDWFSPVYIEDGKVAFSVHSYLIETPTRKLVVDTGVGNGRTRANELLHNLDTSYLEEFRKVWEPADVDGVICTHLHVDHVGWNTRQVDGKWVPTFPNAQYHFVKQEFDFWKSVVDAPDGDGGLEGWARETADVDAVFADSVQPIADAGLIAWAEPNSRITPEVSFVPSHGHTPGHVSVLVESRGESAVITGDLMHSACQLARPDWSAVVDSDQEASTEARQALLERYADTSTILLGSHFGTPNGGRVVRDGDAYRLVPVRG
ncbi:MBL fold metallo-hydrolase [Streptomyces mirabilis]|uniref:MBL fold metallo-hydrolase n=1 Tax=Streptomyces mirabilis TaxID=68239 RepID=UPI003687FEBC